MAAVVLVLPGLVLGDWGRECKRNRRPDDVSLGHGGRPGSQLQQPWSRLAGCTAGRPMWHLKASQPGAMPTEYSRQSQPILEILQTWDHQRDPGESLKRLVVIYGLQL